MKGLKKIKTVENLIEYLQACPPDAEVVIMPEDGDGYPIEGVLAFAADSHTNTPPQVWILLDEFAEERTQEERVMEWSGGAGDDDDDGFERPGDMATVLTVDVPPPEKQDVVQVRGRMRSA